jgi:hypothetical protein
MSRKKRSPSGRIIWQAVVAFLVLLAIRDQLRLPPEERTWQGRVAGRIPYDFRPPTIERLRAAFWNKDTSQVLVPQPFGVGWAVNLYPLLHPGTAQNQQ